MQMMRAYPLVPLEQADRFPRYLRHICRLCLPAVARRTLVDAGGMVITGARRRRVAGGGRPRRGERKSGERVKPSF